MLSNYRAMLQEEAAWPFWPSLDSNAQTGEALNTLSRCVNPYICRVASMRQLLPKSRANSGCASVRRQIPNHRPPHRVERIQFLQLGEESLTVFALPQSQPNESERLEGEEIEVLRRIDAAPIG